MQTIRQNNDRSSTARPVSSAAMSYPYQPYQPSQPHVLTEALKAELAAANQQRRENLYPRLVQNLATVEQNSATRSPSEERALVLQQLAMANTARRKQLRDADSALPA